jgi:dihydroflavonol-4-reductase
MRVLITGAGGFIGHHLVADQLRRDRIVTAVDLRVERLLPLASHPNLRVVQADFRDAAIIEPALKDQAVCFHLASAHLETGVEDAVFWGVNVDGARRLAERACRAGVGRLVHCSSVGVYGNLKHWPVHEDAECNPDIPYERSKLAGEQAVSAFARQTGYPVVIVRPSWVYGPGCPRTIKLFRSIRRGRFFFVGTGETLRHPIYVDDLVAGMELAAMHARAPGQVFILAGPRAVTLRELAHQIAARVGVPPPRLRLPYPAVWAACYLLELAYRPAKKQAPFSRRSLKFYTGNAAFDTRRAAEGLDFRPQVDLHHGVGLTYQAISGQL